MILLKVICLLKNVNTIVIELTEYFSIILTLIISLYLESYNINSFNSMENRLIILKKR